MTADREKSLGQEIIESLREIRDGLRCADPSAKLTIRKVSLDLRPEDYDAQRVRKTRELLGVSQAVFAQLLGVSVKTVGSWEQGARSPEATARRLMDEIRRDTEHWRKVLADATVEA